MRRLLQVAALTATISFLAYSQAAIAVFMKFDSRPSEPLIRIMKQEVDSIMQPSGLLFDWRLLNDKRGDSAFRDLVVLRFKGQCDSVDPTGFPEPPQSVVLGSTLVSGDRVLPFTEVGCNEIRSFIPDSPSRERESLLGRAIGRVVAHEIYHVLLRTTHHSRAGLARTWQTPRDLRSARLVFDPSTSEELRKMNEGRHRPPLLTGNR